MLEWNSARWQRHVRCTSKLYIDHVLSVCMWTDHFFCRDCSKPQCRYVVLNGLSALSNSTNVNAEWKISIDSPARDWWNQSCVGGANGETTGVHIKFPMYSRSTIHSQGAYISIALWPRSPTALSSRKRLQCPKHCLKRRRQGTFLQDIRYILEGSSNSQVISRRSPTEPTSG